MPHKVKLSTGAARYLAMSLNGDGVITSPAELFSAGALLSSHLQPVDTIPKECMTEAGQLNEEKTAEWMATSFTEFEITEAQRDLIKRVLQKLSERGVFKPSKFILELLTAFGLGS